MKLVLISGESFRQVNEKISSIVGNSKNIVTYDLSYNTLEDILTEAGYLSMFQEEKYIIIKNANFFGSDKLNDDDTKMFFNYLEHPNELSTLIFICNEKLDMRKKITKAMKEKYEIIEIPVLKYYEIENKVRDYLQKNNFKIDQNSIKYIVSNSLNNYDISMSEAEKLMLYYKNPCTVIPQDVEKIISKSINTNNFLLVDAIVNGNIKQSLSLYEDLKIMKVDPLAIINLLARDFRIMLEIKIMQRQGKNENEILKALGMQEWQLEKYIQKAFPYKKEELENNLVKLSNADLDIKSGKKDKYIALELLILDLCE